MENIRFEILSTYLLEKYCEVITANYLKKYDQLLESELSIDTFNFYTSVSAVFSSKIEGENIDLDSFIKYKRFGIKFLPDYTKKTDDLYSAYQFAKISVCSQKNIEKAHRILTRNILPKNRQGKVRTAKMFVTTEDGRIEYVAASPFEVKSEMKKFYNDLNILLGAELTIQEIFYFASLLHLVFIKIHPFDDGNGRGGRLVEKWFLGEKLGEKAWLIQSEKNYYSHHDTYYKNIRFLGFEYEKLDYSKALPFLEMLPNSLMTKKENS